MLSLATILCSALLSSVAFAVEPTSNFSKEEVDSLITPGGTGAVPLSTLNSWCISQRGTCTTLCGTGTTNNTCEGDTLEYNCICKSNNSAPALAYYLGTIPAFECPTLRGNCYVTNQDNLAGQEECNVTYVCSSINASTAVVAETTTSAEATAAETGSPTESGSGPSSTSSAAAVAMQVGEQYGVGILTAGLVAILSFVM